MEMDAKKVSTDSTLQNTPKRLGWIIHVVGWGILFILPFIFAGKDTGGISLNNYLKICTILASIIAVFYINHSYLVKRFILKKQNKLYILTNFILITCTILLVHSILNQMPLDPTHVEKKSDLNGKILFYMFQYFLYIFVSGLGVAFKTASSWQKAESERKELERSHSEAELQNLKSQLNPHFLFNTLNNIYSLIAFSPDKAQESVHGLSRLLRYVLYESNEPFVPLNKELTFIRNYVELMRIRLPESIELQTSIQPLQEDVLIAPLLFITPIENAFKHGVSNTKPSFIHIDIQSDNKEIVCTIRNSYFPKDEQDKSGSGIGLENLRKRLALLYPNKHQFDCKQEGDTFYCLLSITL